MMETTPDPAIPHDVARRSRAPRWIGAAVIAMLVVGWFGYLRWVTGVLAHQEKHPGGKIKTAGFLKRTGWSDYKRHGLWTTYHANEKMASQGHYELGHKVGEWKYWDENGEPIAGPTSAESDD